MLPLPFLVANALAILGGAIYTIVGARYLRLSRSSSMQGSAAAFWLGIGAYGMLDGGWGVLAASVPAPLALGVTVLQLKILAVSVGFGSWVWYVGYLYTGNARLLWLVAIFYALVFVLTTYSYAARAPIGQEVRTWGTGLVYANPAGVASDVAYGLLFGPPLVATLAYGRLLPRVHDARQKLRVVATGAVLAVFFAGLILGWITGLVPHWPLIEKVLAVVAGITVLAAAPEVSPRAPPRKARGAHSRSS